MEKQELDLKITEAARVIRSYCIARTSSQTDAEDLAQDIIVEIYRSAVNIRSAEAFYGFMWAVAGNVYKQWCKTRAKRQFCELSDEMFENVSDIDDEHEQVHLLRREMTLLDEKYRKAVILYYLQREPCSRIATILSISESMVKYLLFKSRHILKEGMKMERIYGQQSYNPKNLSLLFWGNGANRYYHLCDSKISQNILYACYNDQLTAEQIALEIGIALPYMEDRLQELCEADVLKKNGKRYYTNIAIFTKEFLTDVQVKTKGLCQRIAELLMEAVEKHKDSIREIGFTGADMGENAFAWQMVCILLYSAIIENLQSRVNLNYPVDRYGTKCFVWGVEKSETGLGIPGFCFGISNMVNKTGDYIQFMDFPINGDMVHHFFFDRQDAVNVLLDIVKGNTCHFSENDRSVVAELVQRGYVVSDACGSRANMPVFTSEEYQRLKDLLKKDTERIADEAEGLMEAVTSVLEQHVPNHLKKMAGDLAYLRLFEDAVSAPTALLFEHKCLLPYYGSGLLPTTYVILK
ncbi:MAG: RNA polymerase sigma factor [Clostridia bacterium]|nr:RNA polymerase sigma factor [Clostridia bacterium]